MTRRHHSGEMVTMMTIMMIIMSKIMKIITIKTITSGGVILIRIITITTIKRLIMITTMKMSYHQSINNKHQYTVKEAITHAIITMMRMTTMKVTRTSCNIHLKVTDHAPFYPSTIQRKTRTPIPEVKRKSLKMTLRHHKVNFLKAILMIPTKEKRIRIRYLISILWMMKYCTTSQSMTITTRMSSTLTPSRNKPFQKQNMMTTRMQTLILIRQPLPYPN
mmetsp:Transcript_23766/g.28998  ORF Transcript_23766/g.28998 Transcript_23766/m.28998 type:complete len:220 (-) Transcript_23766:268-927(-)